MLHEIFEKRPDNQRYQETAMLVDNSTLVGVEVEVEGPIYRAELPAMDYWNVVADGSLREGIEFVTAGQGLAGANVVAAVTELHKVFKKYEHTFSDRCSVHVHLDARKMTRQQVFCMAVLWAYYEEVMFAIAGDWRSANIFCQSFARSNMANLVVSLDRDDAHTRSTAANTGRYAAFNINSLAKHGTIEIRCHEGTSSTKRLLNWINILLSLRSFAMTCTAQDLFNSILRGKGVDVSSVFGKYSPIVEAVDNYNERLKTGKANVLNIYLAWKQLKEAV